MRARPFSWLHRHAGSFIKLSENESEARIHVFSAEIRGLQAFFIKLPKLAVNKPPQIVLCLP